MKWNEMKWKIPNENIDDNWDECCSAAVKKFFLKKESKWYGWGNVIYLLLHDQNIYIDIIQC